MRRSFALVLTALLLVFSLTACGGRNNDTVQDPPTTENSTSDTTQSGTGNANSGTGNTNSGTTQDDNRQDNTSDDTLLDDAGDAAGDVMDGVEDAVDDVLPEDNAVTRQRSAGGVPYGDMMHNDRR